MLLEPSALLRQTVALTAISIGLGAVWQAANVKAAQEMLEKRPFAGAFVAVGPGAEDGESSLSVIESIRNRRTASAVGIPVYALVDACDQALLRKLSALEVQRILIKPFKARVLIEVLSNMAAAPAAEA
jgi:DNA-binding NarL/FixJ family response regulator